jgi:hypothetical protein
MYGQRQADGGRNLGVVFFFCVLPFWLDRRLSEHMSFCEFLCVSSIFIRLFVQGSSTCRLDWFHVIE